MLTSAVIFSVQLKFHFYKKLKCILNACALHFQKDDIHERLINTKLIT